MANGIVPVYLGSSDISQASNLTHVFEIAGLEADTRYYYAVISETTDAKLIRRRTEIGAETPHSFRTQPAAPTEITFGFYSCHDHISAAGDIGAWPHFAEQLADAGAGFVIGGGDQAYVDTNGKNGFLDIWTWLKDNKAALLEKYALGNGKYDEAAIELYLLNIYRWYYRVYWNVPALREVYERFPQYMIWDDHEIMAGWGSLTNKERRARISGFFEEKDSKTNQLLVDLMWRAACRAVEAFGLDGLNLLRRLRTEGRQAHVLIITAKDAYSPKNSLQDVKNMATDISIQVYNDVPLVEGYVIKADVPTIVLDVGSAKGMRKGIVQGTHRP